MNKRPTMLSATFVKNVNVPGRYGDGRGGLGLTLRVKPASRGGYCKSWAQSIRINGQKTTIGLGAYPVITLAMARERAVENARTVALGRDPRCASHGVPIFANAAETVIAIHAENWRLGSRSEQGWRSSLRDYAMPRLGDKRVDAVTTGDVMAVLLPIWSTKRETARRLRHRIGAVMKWAVAQGYRSDNPAGDAISAALPKNGVRIEHRKALPHAEVGAPLHKVRTSGTYQGLVLAFSSATGHMLSQTVMPKLLHQLGIDAVPHGFRSSFRDWAAECTDAPREVCELALAHVNRDRVEAAYRRSDLFERRRELMQNWSDYLSAGA